MSRDSILIYAAALGLGIAIGFLYKFFYTKNAQKKIEAYKKEIDKSSQKIESLSSQNKFLQDKLLELQEQSKKTA